MEGTNGRTYERTHPWITFDLSQLKRASARLWISLGEAQSKCEHLAQMPLRSDTAAKLHHIYLAKGIFATAAIEGNTLTEEQVRQRLDGKLQLPKSQE